MEASTHNETITHYEEALSHLRHLIKYSHTASLSLKGKEAQNQQQYYASIIFSKIVSHAITLNRLAPMHVALPSNAPEEHWDISSICCISRTIVEASDVLSYVADESDNEKFSLLKILVWELHDKERRINMLNGIGSNAPEVFEIKHSAEELRSTILSEEYSSILHPNAKGKIKAENSPDFLIPIKERCIRANVSLSYFQGAKMFLSSYVHTHPLAIHQLENFRVGDTSSINLISLAIRYSVVFLGKAIEYMQALMKNALAGVDETTKYIMETWNSIAASGVNASSS